MKKSKISIYYNENDGFLITPMAIEQNRGTSTFIRPVTESAANIHALELGELAIKALEISDKALPVDPDINGDVLAEVSGIKNFTQFCKKYRKIYIYKAEDGYHISEWIHKKGYYLADGHQIIVSCDAAPDEIGKVILGILDNNNSEKELKTCSFKTLDNKLCTYTTPSDSFIDAGDGHTDAYQVYVHDEYGSDVYMAFLYDCKYETVREAGIKLRWEQMYGNLMEYHFEKIQHGIFKISVEAKTVDKILFSKFHYENDKMIEFHLEIKDKILSAKSVRGIHEEYEMIARSCKIKEEKSTG